MNYIREINAFYDWLELNELSQSGVLLWHALMHLNNKSGWQESFTVARSVIEAKSGLGKDAYYSARNKLRQKGLIDFKERKNKATRFKMISLLSDKQTTDPTATPNTNPTTDPTATPTITKHKLNKEKERRKQVFDTDGEPYQLAKRLFDRIRENNPEHREPDLHKWANDMRLLIEKDKKNPRKIANLIDWVQQDDFEQTNVLSASKLRKRYDQLTMKARREYKQAQQPEQGRGLEKLDPNNLYGEG